ncbi:MAG: hypothetical protein V3571_04490 [Pseudodesulfovibrio sp.]
MAEGRFATLLRLGKPVVAGLALAYMVTAFVDRPAPVHFQPENPFKAQQTAIVEPLVGLVVEKNVMKLGSPLSITPAPAVPAENPLAVLEREERPAVVNDSANASVQRGSAQVPPLAAPGPGNATPSVRGEVDTVAVPLPDPAAQ